MEKSTNFFETWMENQNKMVNNWVEMNEKVQSQMPGVETLQKGTELYNDWLKNQTEMLNSFTKTAKNGANAAETITENTKAAADMYNNWLNTQMKAANNWSETMKNMFGNFYKPNQDMFKGFGDAKNIQDNWMNTYKSWNENFTNSLSGLSNNFSSNSAKEVFNNMLKGNEVYQQVYEFWLNATKNMQDNKFNIDAFKNAFNPMGYKSVIDKLFGFDATGKVKDFFSQTTGMMEEFHANIQKMGKNYQDMLQGENNLFTGMLPVDMQAMTEMYKSYFSNLKNSFSPFFKLAAPGRETELAAVAIELVDDYALFMMKGAQMQHMIYNAGTKAMEEVMKELQNKLKEGEEFSSFQAFYTEWTNTHEKIYTDLFNTEEFSQLQADLIKIDLNIKAAYQKQMEIFLQPFPVVLSKQMDEVYETNYELRKRVRSLEKTVKDLQASMNGNGKAHKEEEEKTAKAATSKTSTASAKK